MKYKIRDIFVVNEDINSFTFSKKWYRGKQSKEANGPIIYTQTMEKDSILICIGIIPSILGYETRYKFKVIKPNTDEFEEYIEEIDFEDLSELTTKIR